MHEPPPRKTAAQWQAQFEAEGLAIHPRTGCHMNMEAVDAIKSARKYSDLYIAEKSKELKKRDEAPTSFSARTLQRARKMDRVLFGSAYTTAMILGCDVREIAILDPPDGAGDEDMGEDAEADGEADAAGGIDEGADGGGPAGLIDGEAQNRGERPAAAPRAPLSRREPRARLYTVSNIVPEISRWLRLLALDVALVSGFYSLFLALGGYEWLRVAFPLVHATGAFLAAYVARSRGRFPMPFNLRVLIGLMAGVLTGMVAFFSIAVLAPERLSDFEDNPVVQASMMLYLVSGIAAFLAGHDLAARRRTRPLAGPNRRMFHWSYPVAIASTGLVAAIGAAKCRIRSETARFRIRSSR
jgi:hypothetical protein